MKIKCLILLTALFIFIKTLFAQQLGWTFDDLVKLKGKEYTKGTPQEGSYTITYSVEKSIVNGKEYPVGSKEVFRFNSITNKVQRYTLLGIKRESDIIDIIEKNNSKFKKVDIGSKQNFYQWIDIQNNAEYTLSIQMQLDDSKFILYDCELKG
jgi:hypothetical protein